MNRKAYCTGLTDERRKLFKPILPPPAARSRKRKVDLRDLLNAIFYLSHTTCQWHDLSHDFPAWQAVYGYFRRFQQSGLLEHAN